MSFEQPSSLPTLKSLVVPNEIPPEDEEDAPLPGVPIAAFEDPLNPLNLPNLVFGAATFSNFYNVDSHLMSSGPVRTTRLALRYGVRAFDTSIYYGPSEVVLGNALRVLRGEFPRESYRLLTKCGRFGSASFDYSREAIRESVKKSLERLQTDYLDVVYLHDTEFIADEVTPRKVGQHKAALTDERELYGLREGEEGLLRGDGDKKILEAFAELRKMKEEGVVKKIGLTGYPVPTLLRLSLLILYTPPFEPVDVVMSYTHLTLQNSLFAEFVPYFRERAKVGQLLTASPLSMGLLSPSIPSWHPAPRELRGAVDAAFKISGGDIVDLSMGYAMRRSEELGMPLVVGLSDIKEVHECVRIWREVKSQSEGEREERLRKEAKVRKVLGEKGFLDWSWASP